METKGEYKKARGVLKDDEPAEETIRRCRGKTTDELNRRMAEFMGWKWDGSYWFEEGKTAGNGWHMQWDPTHNIADAEHLLKKVKEMGMLWFVYWDGDFYNCDIHENCNDIPDFSGEDKENIATAICLAVDKLLDTQESQKTS